MREGCRYQRAAGTRLPLRVRGTTRRFAHTEPDDRARTGSHPPTNDRFAHGNVHSRSQIRGPTARANAGFTAVAVLTLAVGIGANTALFTMLESIFVRPLPGVHTDERLVWITPYAKRAGHAVNLSYPDFVAYRDATRCSKTQRRSIERSFRCRPAARPFAFAVES